MRAKTKNCIQSLIYDFEVQQGNWNREGMSWLIEILAFFFLFFSNSLFFQRLEWPDTTFSDSVWIISHLHLAKSRFATSGGRRSFKNKERKQTEGRVTIQWRSFRWSFWCITLNDSSSQANPLQQHLQSLPVTFILSHILSVFLLDYSCSCRFNPAAHPAEIETAPPSAKVTCHHRLFYGSADGLKSPGGSCKSVVAPLALCDVSGKARWQEWPPVPRCSLRPRRLRLSPRAPPPPPAVVGCHSDWRVKIILKNPLENKHSWTTVRKSHLISMQGDCQQQGKQWEELSFIVVCPLKPCFHKLTVFYCDKKCFLYVALWAL